MHVQKTYFKNNMHEKLSHEKLHVQCTFKMSIYMWKAVKGLYMFKLTVHYTIEKIGKLQRFQKKFELNGTLD